MAHDVFISYSSRDKPPADAVCARLEADGIRCWVAPRDILPGSDWSEAIIDGIEGSRLMLLVFSSNSNGSQQVKREVERAVNKGLVVVPLRIEDVLPGRHLEYFLSTPHWLDAMTRPFEQHLGYVSETVRLILSRSGDEPAPLPPRGTPPHVSRTARRLSGSSAMLAGGALAVVGIGAALGLRGLSSGGDDSAKATTTSVPTAAVDKGLVGSWQLTMGPDSYGCVTIQDLTIDAKGNVKLAVTVDEPGQLDNTYADNPRLLPTSAESDQYAHSFDWPHGQAPPANIKSWLFMPPTASYIAIGFTFGSGVSDQTLNRVTLPKVSEKPVRWHADFVANGLNWTHDVTIDSSGKSLVRVSFSASGVLATSTGPNGSFTYTPSAGPIGKGDFRLLDDGSLLATSEKPTAFSGEFGNQRWKRAQ